MMNLVFRSFILLVIIQPLCGIVFVEHKEKKSICSWGNFTTKGSRCRKHEYKCLNSNCIRYESYCDNHDDCRDNSDERYCDVSRSCPSNPPFIKCSNSRKCIPFEWICNGITNCPYGDDENNCGMFNLEIKPNVLQSLKYVFNWLHNQKIEASSEKWGINVDKLALIFYLGYSNFNISEEKDTVSEFAHELNIQLLSQFIRMETKDVPSAELAFYLNAFLTVCVNPRDFHGYDIVQDLRSRVDKENYTNPYILLALCNAGEIITESDKKKLIDTFWNVHRAFWTDMQAVTIMALACASKQSENNVDSEVLQEMLMELKKSQYRNGTVVNLSTTALVMQALISTDSERDPDNFDEVKALDELLRNQKPDGSFGDLMNTLLVTPVLACRSLEDINSAHCHYKNRDEISALENLANESGPKIRIQYSLWIGDEKDIERNLVLRVPANISLYRVMEIAAEVDSRFKFEYSVKNRKPYINAISGIRDNPLTGKFWFLYTIQNDETKLYNDSPAGIIPRDNDRYVMWYRRGTWVDCNS